MKRFLARRGYIVRDLYTHWENRILKSEVYRIFSSHGIALKGVVRGDLGCPLTSPVRGRRLPSGLAPRTEFYEYSCLTCDSLLEGSLRILQSLPPQTSEPPHPFCWWGSSRQAVWDSLNDSGYGHSPDLTLCCRKGLCVSAPLSAHQLCCYECFLSCIRSSKTYLTTELPELRQMTEMRRRERERREHLLLMSGSFGDFMTHILHSSSR